MSRLIDLPAGSYISVFWKIYSKWYRGTILAIYRYREFNYIKIGYDDGRFYKGKADNIPQWKLEDRPQNPSKPILMFIEPIALSDRIYKYTVDALTGTVTLEVPLNSCIHLKNYIVRPHIIVKGDENYITSTMMKKCSGCKKPLDDSDYKICERCRKKNLKRRRFHESTDKEIHKENLVIRKNFREYFRLYDRLTEIIKNIKNIALRLYPYYVQKINVFRHQKLIDFYRNNDVSLPSTTTTTTSLPINIFIQQVMTNLNILTDHDEHSNLVKSLNNYIDEYNEIQKRCISFMNGYTFSEFYNKWHHHFPSNTVDIYTNWMIAIKDLIFVIEPLVISD